MNTAHQNNRTHRTAIRRILVTLGVTAGFLAATASQASAGLIANHSEPTLHRN